MNEIQIVKIGGNIIDNNDALDRFLLNFSKIQGSKILVHGGGKSASEMSKKMGIPVKMIKGRRITDKETIKLVTGVYAGQINKAVVAKLQALNCDALGLTGADLNIIPAHKRVHPEIDFGYVGDFDTSDINADMLSSLIELSVTPVFCALTHDSEGNMLNTNADTIAAGLAIALSSRYNTTLTYCFEKNGVLTDIEDDNSVIEEINPDYYSDLKKNGVINDGMIPKLDNAFNAIKEGVAKIVIKHADNIMDESGTKLSK